MVLNNLTFADTTSHLTSVNNSLHSMNAPQNSFWLLIQSSESTSYRLGDSLTLACGIWHCLPMAQIRAIQQLWQLSQRENNRISVSLYPNDLLKASSPVAANSEQPLGKVSTSKSSVTQEFFDQESNTLHIKLLNPLRGDFPVGNWRYPTNKLLRVSREEYAKIQEAIEVQQPPPYLPCTTLEVVDPLS